MATIYTFKDFERDVILGREIEMIYNGIMYFITDYHNIGAVLENEITKKYQSFKTRKELLENATIDGKNLKEIWNDIKIETVY